MLVAMFTLGMTAQQFPDRHSTDISDAWVSCTPQPSPNKVREDGHWIMYDLGNVYTIFGSTLWNINGYQETDKGIQDLVIDYSMDGIEWTELGYHTMEQAQASSFYQGEAGPDFGGINARYVLITGLTNYGHPTCFGLSEVRMQATISSISDIDEAEVAKQISVSPNPFSDRTTITFIDLNAGTYPFKIMDIEGKLVQQGQLTISGVRSTHDLLTPNLISGNYIFTLDYGQSAISKPLQIAK